MEIFPEVAFRCATLAAERGVPAAMAAVAHAHATGEVRASVSRLKYALNEGSVSVIEGCVYCVFVQGLGQQVLEELSKQEAMVWYQKLMKLMEKSDFHKVCTTSHQSLDIP